MTHPLKTVSYVADIEGSLVIMAHRTVPSTPNSPVKLTCHVLDTADVSREDTLSFIIFANFLTF